MNRGVLQSSPVQQMMAAGNPNWWNINTMRPPASSHHHHHHHHQYHQQQQPLSSPFLASPNTNFYPQYHHLPNTSTTTTTTSSTTSNNSSTNSSSLINPTSNIPSWLIDNQEQLPESWSQLLLGGLVSDEDQKGNMMSQFQVKKLENWEEQLLCSNQAPNASVVDHVKREHSSAAAVAAAGGYAYGQGSSEDFQAVANKVPNWPNNNNNHHHNPQIMATSSTSSPKSCVTTSFSSNMLDFSNKPDHQAAVRNLPVPADRSSECNSPATGGALKKARVNPASSTQTTFKVRKEKLGDRITALHQLVSPFGKTDTASVLLEAIGYIRFLQSQIEALSLPYLGSGSGNMRQQQSVHGERNCMFPEDPGQLLNDNYMKRKGAPDQQESVEEAKKDLRSRGLCLVPVSCTLQVGSDNGADYWAPSLSGFQ